MEQRDLFFDLIEKNDIVKVKEIIEGGFDINILNKYGSSALHVAISKKSIPMANILIGLGINLNIQNKEGKTSLQLAAEYNLIEIAEVLLEKKADLSIQDKYGNQPLWTAVFNDKGKNERIKMINLFLKNGADINHRNNVGKSPKDIVMIAGYKNIESILG